MGNHFQHQLRESIAEPAPAAPAKSIHSHPPSNSPGWPRYLNVNSPTPGTQEEGELEAERVAEQLVQGNSLDQTSVGTRDSNQQEIQTFGIGSLSPSSVGHSKVPTDVQRTLSSPGQPLDAGTRSHFERHLGRNLAQVRVHADENAHHAAQSLNALAFTRGRDIVFAKNRYAPGTQDGRRLLAHELTHVAQQEGDAGKGPAGPIQRQTPQSVAGEMGERIAEGILDQEGFYVFRDYKKHVNANGFDFLAYDPKEGTLWVVDNKAYSRTIHEATSLSPANFDTNLAEAERYLRQMPDSPRAKAALSALEDGRISRVVTNAYSKGNAGFGAGVFSAGTQAYDVRLGKLYTNRADWLADMQAEGYMTGRRRYSSRDRVLGPRRGFATVGGIIFTLLAVGGTIYAVSETEDKKKALAELTADFIVSGLVYKVAGGLGLVAVEMALNLCSDNAQMQEDCERRAVVMRFLRKHVPSAITKTTWGPFEQEDADPEIYQEAYDLLFNTEPIVVAPEPTAAPMPGARPMDTSLPPSSPSTTPPSPAPAPLEEAAPAPSGPTPAPAAGARPYGPTAPPPSRQAQAPTSQAAPAPQAPKPATQAAPAPDWPLNYEEIPGSKHFQVIPDVSVANGTWSILQPTNSGAIFRVQARPDQGFDMVNVQANNRVVAQVAPSRLLPGGYRLVSGPLKNALDEHFVRWHAKNRSPQLNDLVNPELHFR